MKKNAIRLLAALLCAALVLSLAACGLPGGKDDEEDDSVKEYKDTVVVALDREPAGLLDLETGESAAGRMARMELTQTVFRLAEAESGEQKYVAQPVLVEDGYKTSGDGLTWTFRVREGMLFANGDPITAGDIAATLRLSGVEELVNAEAADERTVTVTTAEPCPQLPRLLCSSAAGVVDEEYLEQHDDAYTSAETANASGPYQLKEWVRGERMELVANPNYHTVSPEGENAKTETLVYVFEPDADARAALLEKGEADLAYGFGLEQADVLGSEGFTLTNALNGAMVYVDFQTADPVLENAGVRQALLYALNVNAIAKELYGTHYGATTGFVSQSVWGYAREGHCSQNPEQCKKLLSEAGYPDGFDTQIAALADNTAHIAVAGMVSGQLKEMGINAEVVVVRDPSELLDYPMAVGQTELYPLDAHELIAAYAADGTVRELVDKAATAFKDKSRLELYREAAHLLYVDEPARINLCELMDVWVSSPKLEDAQFSGADGTAELSTARIAR